jgi:5-methylcytosine-specific restriction endonuclease McrBC regulatory subunit McrC
MLDKTNEALQMVQQFLGKEYIPQSETMSTLRGKIDIAESIKTQSFLKQQMVCEYDEFSENSTMNRIIKSSVELLLRSDNLKLIRKTKSEHLTDFLHMLLRRFYCVTCGCNRLPREQHTVKQRVAFLIYHHYISLIIRHLQALPL